MSPGRLSILFLRFAGQGGAGPADRRGDFQFSFWDSHIATDVETSRLLVTFNSLFEILRGGGRRQGIGIFYFQFSFWDSWWTGRRSRSRRGEYHFQFSFWDSRADRDKDCFKHLGYLSILFLRFVQTTQHQGATYVKILFQFSFWDSPHLGHLAMLTTSLSILFLRFRSGCWRWGSS